MTKNTNYGRKYATFSLIALFIYLYTFSVLFPADESFKIIMEGLEIMNDDPKDVNVLYGKVRIDPLKYNASFQRFVNGISDGFVRRGLHQKKKKNNAKFNLTF